MLNQNWKSAAVALIALSTAALAHAQSVKTTITLPNLPEQVAVDELANRIFVAVPNYGAQPFDYLTVIDGHTDSVIQNIQIPPIAYAVAVDPFTETAYVGGSYTDDNGITQSEVVVVSERTGKVLKTISISSDPGNGIQGLAVNPVNGDLYVTNASDNELDLVRGCELKQRISLSAAPYGVAVNPFTNTIYVALLDGNVSLINGKTNTVTSTTPFGDSNAGIAVNLLTNKVYVTNSVGYPSQGSVGVLNGKGTVLSTVNVGNTPLGIDLDLGTNLVFIANSQDGTISVIDGKTNAVASTLPVSALFLAVNSVTEKVYIAPAANTPALTVLNEK
jgi:YVTN family beta-propeller protein